MLTHYGPSTRPRRDAAEAEPGISRLRRATMRKRALPGGAIIAALLLSLPAYGQTYDGSAYAFPVPDMVGPLIGSYALDGLPEGEASGSQGGSGLSPTMQRYCAQWPNEGVCRAHSAGGAAATMAVPPPAVTSTVSPAEVAQAQAQLRGLGYDPGPVDGVFGQRTAAAVQAFQSDRRLAVDGSLTAESLALIAAEAARSGTSPTVTATPAAAAPSPDRMNELMNALAPEYARRIREEGQAAADRWLTETAWEMGRRDGEAAR